MKAPLLKKLRLGSHDVVLMFWLDQFKPSLDSAWKVSILVLLGSFLRSYQMATHLPSGRDAKDAASKGTSVLVDAFVVRA